MGQIPDQDTENKYAKVVEAMRDSFLEHVAIGRSPEDVERISQAYEFAHRAHYGQKRKNGEPYIIHPISVASIVDVEMGLGTNPIIASLLHDVVEDTPYNIDDIRQAFGDDVAFLVSGLTKEYKEHYELSKQVDNIRKMLMTIEYDIRALLIKLADRLHNMRTLGSMPLDKQMKITGETDYFYAPLANRLGLYRVKTELEDLSFQFRMPEEYERLQRTIKEYSESTEVIVNRFTQKVQNYLNSAGVNATVTAYVRSIYSLWQKLQKYQVPLRRLESVHVFDIVFEPQEEAPAIMTEKNQCLLIYSLLTDLYKEKVGSFHNYVDVPKANGYEGMHCKFMTEHGSWAEVHVRSKRMDEASKRGCIVQRQKSMGIGGVDAWVETFRGVLKDLAYRSKNGGDTISFLEDVKTSLYQDDIRVYTPKGDEIQMPLNATAIDLAYEIHTHIGDKAQFARINGQLSSIKTILKRGDRVEIGTDDHAGPQPDWLDVVQTYKAKSCIRAYLRKQRIATPSKKYQFETCCSPLPGDELIGFKGNSEKDLIRVHLRSCPNAILESTEHGERIATSLEILADEYVFYPAQILVTGVDRKGVTFELLKVVANDYKLDVNGLKMNTQDSLFNCTMSIQVRSARELSRIMLKISSLQGVEDVRRL